jgi:hypothetical protein
MGFAVARKRGNQGLLAVALVLGAAALTLFVTAAMFPSLSGPRAGRHFEAATAITTRVFTHGLRPMDRRRHRPFGGHDGDRRRDRVPRARIKQFGFTCFSLHDLGILGA